MRERKHRQKAERNLKLKYTKNKATLAKKIKKIHKNDKYI